MANISRLSSQRLLVFLMQVATLNTRLDDIPGKEFIGSALTMEVEGRIEANLPTSRLQTATLGKEW